MVCAPLDSPAAGDVAFNSFVTRNFQITLEAGQAATFPIMAEAATAGGTAGSLRGHRVVVSCRANDAAATFREAYIHAQLLG